MNFYLFELECALYQQLKSKRSYYQSFRFGKLDQLSSTISMFKDSLILVIVIKDWGSDIKTSMVYQVASIRTFRTSFLTTK